MEVGDRVGCKEEFFCLDPDREVFRSVRGFILSIFYPVCAHMDTLFDRARRAHSVLNFVLLKKITPFWGFEREGTNVWVVPAK